MKRIDADIAVVGSGSAGAVVAGTLARDQGRRIALVEAGGGAWNPLLRVPLMTGVLLRGRYANWSFRTEPEPNLDGRVIAWPRGKVIGGSSAINGMVWTRGIPADYDGWAQRGLPEWRWETVLAAFRAIERHHMGASEHHGGDGPQPVTRPPGLHPLSEAFLTAAGEAGLPTTDDFNGPHPEGAGRYDFTIANGRRVSAATAYLSPVAGQRNLSVLTRAHARRILFNGHHATGLLVRQGGEDVEVRADTVVLCAGAVMSPHLLMLSGIGPADALAAHDIPITVDLPGVGQNLRDHLLVRVEHTSREPITLQRILRADRAVMALGQALATGTGPAARFPLEVGAFLRSDPALEVPDLQSHFLPGLSTALLRHPLSGGKAQHGFFANVYQLRPHSVGEIKLRSADPSATPMICPNYLSAAADRVALKAGIRLLRDIFSRPAFDRYRGEELAPGAAATSDADLDAFLRQKADTVFHPVGTCRMGNDAMAVVDGTLNVHGVEGLMVADASVMPTMPGCNTHAPSMMIGARAADFLSRANMPEAAHVA